MRLREENRALLNSVLGTAGVPPIETPPLHPAERAGGAAAIVAADRDARERLRRRAKRGPRRARERLRRDCGTARGGARAELRSMHRLW